MRTGFSSFVLFENLAGDGDVAGLRRPLQRVSPKGADKPHLLAARVGGSCQHGVAGSLAVSDPAASEFAANEAEIRSDAHEPKNSSQVRGAIDQGKCFGVRLAIAGLSVAALLVAPSSALAHGGGLDANGCHHDRKRGGYHCHRGAQAGRSFTSKAEAQGAAVAPSPGRAVAPSPAPAQRSIEQRLRELAKLREQGLVTEDEYQQKRREILSEL